MHVTIHISYQAIPRPTARTRPTQRAKRIPQFSYAPLPLLLLSTFRAERRRRSSGGCSIHRNGRPALWTVRCEVCQRRMWIFRLVLISALVGREYSLNVLYIPVPLERVYPELGVPVKKYPRRGKYRFLFLHRSIGSLTDTAAPNEARPRLVLHVSEIERENQLQESSTYSVRLFIFPYR
jgi:hypothetical protein